MPWRVYDYAMNNDGFNLYYLFDFCYWVNAAVAVFLALDSTQQFPNVAAALYSLADGPVAWALLAWQCRWTLTSADHSTSTLMHLLPGLAMFSHWHFPSGAVTWLERVQSLEVTPAVSWAQHAPLLHQLGWRLALPCLFYAAWQLQYWVVVQLCCAAHIQREGRDTSFRCLARRAKRAGNFLSRLVLRGSTTRRIAAYGILQAVFTLGTLALAQPTLNSFPLACAWQLLKFAAPLWAACRHQARAAAVANMPAALDGQAQQECCRKSRTGLAAPAS